MVVADPARALLAGAGRMVQAQDVLGLGSEARMNDPARAGGNWRWQMEPGALTAGARRAPARRDRGRRPARVRLVAVVAASLDLR